MRRSDRVFGIEINRYSFINDENFHFDGFVKLIQEKPEMVKPTMHLQLWETGGNTAETRLKFLHNAFNSIIDYSVPDGVKIGMVLTQNITETTVKQYKEFKHFSKLKKDEFLHEKHIPEIIKILFNCDQADKIFAFINKFREITEYTYEQMQQWIFEIIRLRNKIFKILETGNKVLVDQYPNYNVEEMNLLAMVWYKFRKQEFINKFPLWKIPLKSQVDVETDDLWLSDPETAN